MRAPPRFQRSLLLLSSFAGAPVVGFYILRNIQQSLQTQCETVMCAQSLDYFLHPSSQWYGKGTSLLWLFFQVTIRNMVHLFTTFTHFLSHTHCAYNTRTFDSHQRQDTDPQDQYFAQRYVNTEPQW